MAAAGADGLNTPVRRSIGAQRTKRDELLSIFETTIGPSGDVLRQGFGAGRPVNAIDAPIRLNDAILIARGE